VVEKTELYTPCVTRTCTYLQ